MKHFAKQATAALLAGIMLSAGTLSAMASENDEIYLSQEEQIVNETQDQNETQEIFSSQYMTAATPGYTATGNDYISKIGKTSEPYVCAAEIQNGRIIEYTYDAKGHILSCSDNGRVEKYSYNSKGFCIAKETVLESSGTRLAYEKYTCDSSGRRISTEVVSDEMGWSDEWFDDDYKSTKMTYSYDSLGRIASIYGTDGNGNDFTKKFSYKNGYLSSVSMSSAYVNGTAVYSYNADYSRAHITETTKMSLSQYTREFEYDFDQYGNTILRKDCDNKQITRNVVMPLSKYLSYKDVKGFSDVSNSAYYRVPVKWAVYKNITKGTSTKAFSPSAVCTRGQIVTFLWRAAGSPKASGKNPFGDVKSNSYYYDAVLWAVKNGITKGTKDTVFSPNESCTRAQAVTFLWRALGGPKADGTGSLFTDVKKSAYYYNAVQWAVEDGVTNGVNDISFAPNEKCTRAQIVTFLYRGMA